MTTAPTLSLLCFSLDALRLALPLDASERVVRAVAVTPLPGLCQWLGQTTGPTVQIASSGLRPHAAHAYPAPNEMHQEFTADGSLRLSREAPGDAIRPCVNRLFHSLAQHLGSAAIGVLLTGMGKDSAQGLQAMRACGALTLAQDHDSSAVQRYSGRSHRHRRRRADPAAGPNSSSAVRGGART